MALGTTDDSTQRGDVPPTYPSYSKPPATASAPQRGTDTTTAEVITGGASLEAVGGGAAIVLAIIGLAGYLPFYMAAIATIAAGGAILVHGAAVAARWRQTIERFRAERNEELVVSGGMGADVIGGAGGIVLGILALAGIMPTVLLPVAAIVLGASVFLAGPAQPEVAKLAFDGDRRIERIANDAARSAGGMDILVGAGAAVLGILALVHIGPPLVMTMVAMLAIGAGLLVAGGVLAARFGRSLQHA